MQIEKFYQDILKDSFLEATLEMWERLVRGTGDSKLSLGKDWQQREIILEREVADIYNFNINCKYLNFSRICKSYQPAFLHLSIQSGRY